MKRVNSLCARLLAVAAFLAGAGAVGAVPVLDALPDTAIYEDALFTFTVAASDTDSMAAVPEYALLSGPDMVALDGVTGLLTWLPENGDVGTDTVTVRAYTGEGADTGRMVIIVLNVNDPPVLDDFMSGDAYEDSLFRTVVTATDDDAGDSLRFVLLYAPGGMAVDAVTGSLAWVPGAADTGITTLRVGVFDAAGAADSLETYLTVRAVNDTPVFLTAALDTALEDRAYRFALSVADEEGGPLTFVPGDVPAGLSLDADSGIISWLPGNDDVGDHEVEVTVFDDGLDVTRSFVLTVRNVNDAPFFCAVPETHLVEDRAYVDTLHADDIDAGDSVFVFRLTRAPAGMAVDSVSGALAWTPGQDDAGHDTLVAVVRDAAGAADTLVLPFTVEAVNDAPVILTAALDTAREDAPYRFVLTAVDEEGDPLTWRLTDGPGELSLLPDSGIIAWVPVNADVGIHTMGLRVTDAAGNVVDTMYQLVVVNVNDTPAVMPVAPSADETLGDTAVFAWRGSDPDVDDALLYTLEIAADTLFTATVFSGPSTADTFFIVAGSGSPFVPGSTYYWRVLVCDRAGAEAVSVPLPVRFRPEPVGVPHIVAGTGTRIILTVDGMRLPLSGTGPVTVYRLDSGRMAAELYGGTGAGRLRLPAAGTYAACRGGAQVRFYAARAGAAVTVTTILYRE